MNKKETTRILNNNKDLLALYQKVVDKLEQRISTLEKVLESHAKCIGEMRDKKDE
jgi:F420-0:gamma-glutamyl ligase